MYEVLPKKLRQPPRALAKILLIMRLTTLILITAILQVSASSHAQKISLTERNASLTHVLERISAQTGFDFLYESAKLKDIKNITIDVQNEELKEVLSKVLEPRALEFTIEDNSVIIKEKEPSLASVILKSVQDLFQSIDVTGRIVDQEGIPIPGATIRVKGTNRSAVSNASGHFAILNVDEKAVIVVSYVGFTSKELPASKDLGEIRLVMASAELQEVTINKGYYTTSKELNTGSVASVSAEEIQRQPISDPILALQGRVPGLQIQQNNGVAGRSQKVRLRGQNSLENGNEPLYIVDGVPYNSTPLNNNMSLQSTIGGSASPFNYLNSQDIERIDILKDADATALYGSRGANGVILITTKKGVKGKTELDASIYKGYSNSIKRVNFMDRDQYLSMRWEAFANDKKSPVARDYDLNGTWDTTRQTNWQNYLIGGTAPVTESTIGLSGGNERTTFRISGTFRKEGTVFPVDLSSTKASGNLSLNHQSLNRKLSINATTSYIYSANNLVNGGVNIENQIVLSPVAPSIFSSDGSLNWQNSTWTNPYAIYKQIAEEEANNFISNLLVSYKVHPDITLKSSFGFNKTIFEQINLRPYSSINPSLGIDPVAYRGHFVLKNDNTSWIIEPQVAFSHSYKFGKIDALVGTSFQSSVGDFLNMRGTGFQSDELLKNFASATTFFGIRSGTEYKYSALYARLGYTFHDRYIFNATARRDGSSRFGPGKRFGNFGSIGAAWIFSKESWFNSSVPWISFGKARASYGITGNDQIGDYNYLDLYSVNTVLYQNNPGFIPFRLTNPLYGWEQVDKVETALELGFLEDRFKVELSYYRNRTKNQLVRYALPTITGFDNVTANIPAVLENSGIELSFSSVNIESNKFTWKTDFNISFPKNKLVSYPGIEYSSYSRRYIVGQPTSLLFLYHYLGKDTEGLFSFEDRNHDGAFTAVGDQIPIFVGQKYFGGINNNILYKRFDISFLLQFAKQNGLGYFGNGLPGTLQNQPVYDNSESYRQRYTQSDATINNLNSRFYSSDGVITDASYISLKNLAISYSIPFRGKISRVLPNCKVFALGQNVLTISNYQGFHPEAPSASIIYPLQRVFTFGLKVTIL